MIRLTKHEEIVEAMARTIASVARGEDHDEFDVGVASAALDALLATVVEKGVGREAIQTWNGAAHCKHPEDADALILKLEPSFRDVSDRLLPHSLALAAKEPKP